MEPNYSQYTADELKEALEFIDKESFPDRYAAILEQLELRKSTPIITVNEPKKMKTAQKNVPLVNQLLLLIFALFNLFTSVNGLVQGQIAGGRGNIFSAKEDPGLFKFAVAGGFFISALCFYFIYTARRDNKQ